MTVIRSTYDTVTGGFRAESGPPYVDETFVSPPNETNFSLATDINTTQVIDVWVNGMRMFEGALDDWTRDDSTDEIIFNDGLPDGARVDVRVWDY